MRYKVTLLIITSLLVSVTVRSQHKSVDFSGKWKLNREMSDFGTGRNGQKRSPRTSGMEIQQDEKDFKVMFEFTDREGKKKKAEYMYSLEGKKTKNKMDYGKQESTTRWIENGQMLEITSVSHIKRGDMEFDMEVVQYFSFKDGRLVIESTRYTPRGEMETLAVYESVSASDEE